MTKKEVIVCAAALTTIYAGLGALAALVEENSHKSDELERRMNALEEYAITKHSEDYAEIEVLKQTQVRHEHEMNSYFKRLEEQQVILAQNVSAYMESK